MKFSTILSPSDFRCFLSIFVNHTQALCWILRLIISCDSCHIEALWHWSTTMECNALGHHCQYPWKLAMAFQSNIASFCHADILAAKLHTKVSLGQPGAPKQFYHLIFYQGNPLIKASIFLLCISVQFQHPVRFSLSASSPLLIEVLIIVTQTLPL